MSKKLNIQSVDAAHQAAADAATKANEVYEALRERLVRDHRLAGVLCTLIGTLLDKFENPDRSGPAGSVDAKFHAELEPVANSYGFTLVDHPTRRDLVVVEKIGGAA